MKNLKSKPRAQQKFNLNWEKDPLVSFYTKRVILEEDQRSKVAQNKYDDYHFFCNLCQVKIRCEHFNLHRYKSLSHILSTPIDKRCSDQKKFHEESNNMEKLKQINKKINNP